MSLPPYAGHKRDHRALFSRLRIYLLVLLLRMRRVGLLALVIFVADRIRRQQHFAKVGLCSCALPVIYVP